MTDGGRFASGLEKSFAQVHEVALDLSLARAAQIRLGDGDTIERVAPVDVLVRADDLSVFQRERVE